MEKHELILNHLASECIGKRNAIRSKELEQMYNVGGETLRRMINHLRQDGEPICSGRNGYWFAEDLDEVMQTKENLVSRMFGIKSAVKGLDKYISQKQEQQLRKTHKQLTMEDFM